MGLDAQTVPRRNMNTQMMRRNASFAVHHRTEVVAQIAQRESIVTALVAINAVGVDQLQPVAAVQTVPQRNTRSKNIAMGSGNAAPHFKSEGKCILRNLHTKVKSMRFE
jgi:hypothetical protein